MTTNIYLQELAKKDKIKLDYIIFKDQISQIKYKPGLNIILNMSNSGHPGTHWVSLHTYSNMLLYFDSFGIEPPEEVVDWAVSNNKKIIYNDYQIQHLKSIECGQHSLGVLALTQDVIKRNLLVDNIKP